MILFASDLDNTLIFSYKKVIEDSISKELIRCVEKKETKELSFMTISSYNSLQNIKDKVVFVPVTTRSVEQYKRIELIKNSYPHYALTCNGGLLLIDNQIDEKWYTDTLELIHSNISELNRAVKILSMDKNIYLKAKFVDELFVFGKTSDIEQTTSSLNDSLDLNKVNVSNIGDKIYILPKSLNKGIALDRLKKRLCIDYAICAGDSDFDIPMLQKADMSIIPKHNCIYDCLKPHKNLLVSSLKGINFSDYIFSLLLNNI